MTHICVGKLAIIGSYNGLLPGRHQAIIWINSGILLIEPSGTNFSEIFIKIHTFSWKKIHLKMSSAKYCPFCFGLSVLTDTLLVSKASFSGYHDFQMASSKMVHNVFRNISALRSGSRKSPFVKCLMMNHVVGLVTTSLELPSKWGWIGIRGINPTNTNCIYLFQEQTFNSGLCFFGFFSFFLIIPLSFHLLDQKSPL